MVWSAAGGLRQVANGALVQRAGVALQVDHLDRIARLGAGSNGVRAVMAGFTVQPTVPGGVTIQDIVLLEAGLGVAVIAARLVQPRIGILLDLIHAAVAAGAVHAVLGRHDIPQALCRGARVAVVTAVG